MATPDGAPNPFPGLRPFEFEENYLFFGRDGQTDELLSRLRRHHFLAVVGTSGSGKSSLVRAGLLPDIHGGLMVAAGSSWRVALFKPGNDPIGNLARALSAPAALAATESEGASKPIIDSTLRRSALGLIEVVRQERVDGNLLVVADQFEEIFRFQQASTAQHPADEAAAFVKLLLEAARQSEQPIYVVLTMRSDYLGDCAQFGGLPEAINEGLYLIPRMTRDQRREAITGPVAVGGGEIAPRLVNRLLNDVGDNPDQLPILQHALMRMWDCWKAGDTTAPIDLQHYERVGTLSGALSQQADEAFNELTPRGQELAPKIFKRLTEKGGDNREVRRPAALSELVEVSGGTEEEVKTVIETFRAPGRSFLMPPADRPLEPSSLIDISHESLIRGWSRLRAWVDEEAASAEVYSRLAETAQLHEAGQAGLWRDPDLQLALTWRERNQPTRTWAQRYYADFDRALGFLDNSRAARDEENAERERERRTRRAWRNAVAVVLVIGSAVAWFLATKATIAQRKAVAAQNAAEESTRKLRSAALRERQQNLNDQTRIAEMADRLVELTSPEEAAIWQIYKGAALMTARRHKEAITAFEAALRAQPQRTLARFHLGYAYLISGESDKALAQTDAALRTIPNNFNALQNRAIALAGLGRYEEAAAALAKAATLPHTAEGGGTENELAPEIKQALGRTAMVMDEDALRAASNAELANLQAYAGGAGFEQRLNETLALNPPPETYLGAVNWAWLQLKFRPQDYGALAAEGIWWKQAGLRPWAKRAFMQFRAQHAERLDPRYRDLARWAEAQLATVRDEDAPAEVEHADTLAFDALEFEYQKRWDDAQRAMDRAVALAPDNVDFRLQRAMLWADRGLGCEDKDEAKKCYLTAQSECDAIINRWPQVPLTYRNRGFLKQRLKAPVAEIEADFRKVLAMDPGNAPVMMDIANMIEQERPDEALRLFEEARDHTLAYADVPYAYSSIASIHEKQGRFKEALQSLDRAISMSPDSSWWYERRAGLQRKLGWSEADVTTQLAAGYRQVGDVEAKRGKPNDAFQSYWNSLDTLLAQKGVSTQPLTQQEIGVLFGRLSMAVERIDSREKAAQFWHVINDSGRFPELQRQIASEIDRLGRLPPPESQP